MIRDEGYLSFKDILKMDKQYLVTMIVEEVLPTNQQVIKKASTILTDTYKTATVIAKERDKKHNSKFDYIAVDEIIVANNWWYSAIIDDQIIKFHICKFDILRIKGKQY